MAFVVDARARRRLGIEGRPDQGRMGLDIVGRERKQVGLVHGFEPGGHVVIVFRQDL